MPKKASLWITTEKAVLSKVMHWVRVTAVLPGQSMTKMWQERNGTIPSRKYDVLTETQIAEGDKELLILAPWAHAPGRAEHSWV